MASRAKNQWVDQEDVLVYQVPSHQRLNELAAAKDEQILVQLLLEPCHGLSRIPIEQPGCALGALPTLLRTRIGRHRGSALLLYNLPLGAHTSCSYACRLEISAILTFRYNPHEDSIDIGGHNLVQTKKYRDAVRHGRVAFVVDDVLPSGKTRMNGNPIPSLFSPLSRKLQCHG